MNENIYCSRCFNFGHTKSECHCELPSIDYFLKEIDNRISLILDQNKNFADSEDEFGPYQKLSDRSKLENVPINYASDFIKKYFPNQTEKTAKLQKLGEQLDQIYENHLKPTEKETYLRFWSIHKISKIIESLFEGSVCIPQGSSLNGTFLSNSDVDLLVFNIDKEKFEKLFKELETKISDKNGNLNEILFELKFYPRKRVSFIGCYDKETGIKYEIILGSVGGILCGQRMKNYFKKFEKIHLKKISVLFKSFINCIEGGKIFSGGFSSTMILQLCQFIAMRHESSSDNEIIESVSLFLEIIDFLSNVKNFEDIVICASSGKGEFFTRPIEIKGKPFLIMMDSTERNSFLMGNISEKTQFISDQSKAFLNAIQKVVSEKNDFSIESIFPGFSIDFHSNISDVDSDVNLSDSCIEKVKTITFEREFIEKGKSFLVMKKNDTEIKKFCIDFFRPESAVDFSMHADDGTETVLTALKYDSRYSITVDLIHELKTKESPGIIEKLNTEEFIKKFPSFDMGAISLHEFYINLKYAL
ncbi:hypothetical protein M9Y10_002932 [Tritrichomonas musculus]|uniref:Poly(A) RNA polymerase mitochondrial-like central palm domain-containing protein n=1 Tax=Tritrichomonas musculus TaxID=1915356 RepID=A0ABR2LBY6_9EUKA